MALNSEVLEVIQSFMYLEAINAANRRTKSDVSNRVSDECKLLVVMKRIM